jgi:hypothetical protein
MKLRSLGTTAALAILQAALPLGAQSFDTARIEVTLDRRLPALTRLPANTIQVTVTAATGSGADVAHDLGVQLEAELLKDDPQLEQVSVNPAIIITGKVTNYAPARRTAMPRASAGTSASGGQAAAKNILRVTSSLTLAFQVKTSDGAEIVSDNIAVSYDREFSADGENAPTDTELRQTLMSMAVEQMAAHIVNTDQPMEVYLARDKSLDEGDKAAAAGLWDSALAAFQTTLPLPKKEDDAWRLYNIGVAEEELAYEAHDPKSAMDLLGDAAIQYGKAIDSRPDESYFIEPQKRVESALAHYRKLEQERTAATAPPPTLAAAPVPASTADTRNPQPAPSGATTGAAARPLTNQQVIAMVRAGMDDGTVSQRVSNAKAVDFDLSATGRKHLSDAGVDTAVIDAMSARALKDLHFNP